MPAKYGIPLSLNKRQTSIAFVFSVSLPLMWNMLFSVLYESSFFNTCHNNNNISHQQVLEIFQIMVD